MIRTYSDLRRLDTIKERFRYLALHGVVGDTTFGFDRYLNQNFYRSVQWKQMRSKIIVRDEGCDLGLIGNEIHDKIFIHHMNPMTAGEIIDGDYRILDPEFLIAVSLQTHNAIHYGDESQLPKPLIQRKPGDTKLW